MGAVPPPSYKHQSLFLYPALGSWENSLGEPLRKKKEERGGARLEEGVWGGCGQCGVAVASLAKDLSWS